MSCSATVWNIHVVHDIRTNVFPGDRQYRDQTNSYLYILSDSDKCLEIHWTMVRSVDGQ